MLSTRGLPDVVLAAFREPTPPAPPEPQAPLAVPPCRLRELIEGEPPSALGRCGPGEQPPPFCD